MAEEPAILRLLKKIPKRTSKLLAQITAAVAVVFGGLFLFGVHNDAVARVAIWSIVACGICIVAFLIAPKPEDSIKPPPADEESKPE
jgi:hypothetical protein